MKARFLTALLAGAFAAAAQAPLTLEQAGARRLPDFRAAHLDETVVVQGVVAADPVHFQQYTHVGIQDDRFGLLLEGTGDAFVHLHPGDDVEVTGKISQRGGIPVMLPTAWRLVAKLRPPAPQPVAVAALQGFELLGRLVTTEAEVVDVGENAGGTYLLVGPMRPPYKIFVPRTEGKLAPALTGYSIGDRVRVTGVASQYCAAPPFNRWFELIMDDQAGIVVTSRAWPVRPRGAVALLLLLASAGFLWWWRERRLNRQREMLRGAYRLGEEILGAASAADIVKKTALVLPALFRTSQVRLYAASPGSKSMNLLLGEPEAEPVSISLESPGRQEGVVTCFQNRTMLFIPDTSRSPFAAAEGARSALFVPMFTQGDAVGVLELDQTNRTREFTPDEQTLVQHLANQIGAALKLLDQRSVREQLFRTEKLAAVGRLISGVVNELQSPLSSIVQMAERSGATSEDGNLAVHDLLSEARRATDIVNRLVAFAGTDQAEAKPVDINGLLRNLVEFRERECKSRGIRIQGQFAEQPLFVLGSRGQLEQVFLNLLLYAEHALASAEEKVITLKTSGLRNRVLIEIAHSNPAAPDPFAEPADQSAGALDTGVCRGIVAGHGGELRALREPGGHPRFETDLPWVRRDGRAAPVERPASERAQTATALVIEPDEMVHRQLLALLSERNYRVVPVHNSDVGLDLAQRLRFDVAFCDVRAPGLNWIELSERLHNRVGAFVLLCDGYDAELVADFEGEGRFVLPKPINKTLLDRILLGSEAAV